MFQYITESFFNFFRQNIFILKKHFMLKKVKFFFLDCKFQMVGFRTFLRTFQSLIANTIPYFEKKNIFIS